MPAVKRSLYIEQGATWALGFTWYHIAVDGEGNPILDPDGNPTRGDPYWTNNFVGITADMQIRETVSKPVLTEASTDNGKIVISANGRVDIVLSDEDTMLLTKPKAVYDLEIQLTSVDRRRVLQGPVQVSLNVTREVTP